MNDAVRELAADSGALRRVVGRGSVAGYEVLELTFDNGNLRLACHGDTDEIAIDVTAEAATHATEVRDDAFADVVGKIIELAWTMVNSRGYEDAFQLRLLDLVTRRESCLQFEVLASAITVSRVAVDSESR